MKKNTLVLALFLSTTFIVVAENNISQNSGQVKEDPGFSYYIAQLKDTGLTGLALAFVAVIGFGFALERAFQMKKNKVVPSGLAEAATELWKRGDLEGIKIICDKKPSTLAKLITKIVEYKDANKKQISEIIVDIAGREMKRHLQKAYPIAVAATVSPLLGLFGTVVGMINAFKNVALAGEMGDPTKMAGDISFALMTTAMGLVIAVPCLILYHFFRIKANMFALELEEKSSEILISWFPENRG